MSRDILAIGRAVTDTWDHFSDHEGPEFSAIRAALYVLMEKINQQTRREPSEPVELSPPPISSIVKAARELVNAWYAGPINVTGPGAERFVRAIAGVREATALLDFDVAEAPDGAISMDSMIIGVKIADAVQILLAAQRVSQVMPSTSVPPTALGTALGELDNAVRRGMR